MTVLQETNVCFDDLGEGEKKCIMVFLLQLQAYDSEQIILYNIMWEMKTVTFL